ncbi:type II toxin-antitoxin system HigB family toxin [Pseudomonas mandelii]|uniref:type II toxin-antitoxin system HigB family toxin n=1 Tax=Pseudomonas mandelii TaxID=75612 RepID=UPI0020A027D4|nr:type II toxin-antitoxin system HigB family toxin [Pseudomonas mandelii]MCO8312475.1 type II toxin-antitoxin system HigB family toxin [Pseudomonas mandelii]
MHLVGKDILGGLKGRNPEVDIWVSAWTAELEHAIWAHQADLIDQFPSVREKSAGIFIFEVGLAKCWLEVRIVFPQKIARIVAILGAEEIDGH